MRCGSTLTSTSKTQASVTFPDYNLSIWLLSTEHWTLILLTAHLPQTFAIPGKLLMVSANLAICSNLCPPTWLFEAREGRFLLSIWEQGRRAEPWSLCDTWGYSRRRNADSLLWRVGSAKEESWEVTWTSRFHSVLHWTVRAGTLTIRSFPGHTFAHFRRYTNSVERSIEPQASALSESFWDIHFLPMASGKVANIWEAITLTQSISSKKKATRSSATDLEVVSEY